MIATGSMLEHARLEMHHAEIRISIYVQVFVIIQIMTSMCISSNWVCVYLFLISFDVCIYYVLTDYKML
jgi:hypothetical protein